MAGDRWLELDSLELDRSMRFVQRVMPNRLSMYPPQAERHRLSADDVYFLLEIRECKTGDLLVSKALCLGQATEDARGPGYCWLVPEMPTVIDGPWCLDGSGFYRRTDGRVHHLDFVLSRRPGESFQFPGAEDDDDEDNDFDSNSDGSGSEEGEEEGEESEEDGFIDDGDGGERSSSSGERSGEEDSDDGSDASEGGRHREDEEDEDEDEQDEQDEEDEEAAKAPKRRRRVVESDEDGDDESDGAGGEAVLVPQYDGAGSEEEDDTDDSGGEEADDSEDGGDDSLPNSGDHEVSRKDFCEEMNLIVAHAPCDPSDDDDDEDEPIHRQCCLSFECSAENDHVPKVILQFQSGDFDLWEPESSWVGEHGRRRTAGIWAILDSLRWG